MSFIRYMVVAPIALLISVSLILMVPYALGMTDKTVFDAPGPVCYLFGGSGGRNDDGLGRDTRCNPALSDQEDALRAQYPFSELVAGLRGRWEYYIDGYSVAPDPQYEDDDPYLGPEEPAITMEDQDLTVEDDGKKSVWDVIWWD